RRHTRLQGDWSSDVCSSDLEAFDSEGSYHNSSDGLFRSIGTYLAPDDPPPPVPSPDFTQVARSVVDPSVQSAIVAAVEKDRKHRSEERRVGKAGTSRSSTPP